MEKFDLIVIGSGPGGYVAAIHAAKRGMKVACVEKDSTFGGTCLNVGCIPSKALLHSTEYYHRIHEQGDLHGISFLELKVDLPRMMKRKEEVVSSLVKGVASLFKNNKITTIQGQARLVTPTSVAVGEKTYESRFILIATGSEPIPLPFLPFDEKFVLSSTGALSLPKIPQKMLLVGAGIIGLELGSIYRRLGTEIEIIELLDHILPSFDEEVSKHMLLILKKQGMVFHLGSKVSSGEIQNDRVFLSIDSQKNQIEGDVVLVGIGRRAFTGGLGVQELGIELDKQGRIKVGGNFQTAVKTVFAIGDVIEGPMLAHKASEEAIAVVDYLTNGKSHVNYMAIPNVMYTWPEVASVGMTEKEAKDAGLKLKIGKVPFKAIPRARASGDVEGFVKIIGESTSDRLIGMHIIGPNASEMIQEGVIGIEKKITLTELGAASHAHPTCSEAIKEAALLANADAIHF